MTAGTIDRVQPVESVRAEIDWFRAKLAVDTRYEFGDLTEEHCEQPALLAGGHSVWLTTPPSFAYRIVIEHAPGCGCDALPGHVLLEG